MDESSSDIKKVNIADLTVDELMAVAKRPLKKPIKKKKTGQGYTNRTEHIKDFILSENIKSHASILVPSLVVYDRYFKWVANSPDSPLHINMFSKEFNKMFKAVTRGKQKCYLLHPEGFNLSDEYYASIKEKYSNFKKKTS